MVEIKKNFYKKTFLFEVNTKSKLKFLLYTQSIACLLACFPRAPLPYMISFLSVSYSFLIGNIKGNHLKMLYVKRNEKHPKIGPLHFS